MTHRREATGHVGSDSGQTPRRGCPTTGSRSGTVGFVRALGVDLGTRRVGLALSDSGGRLATPLEVLERSGSEAQDHAAIAEIVTDHGVEVVVVGLPRSLDGSMGPAARAAKAEVGRLAATVGVPVQTCDERLSTTEAERHLEMAEVRGVRRRQVVDMVAAAVLLQSWLDARRHRAPRT